MSTADYSARRDLLENRRYVEWLTQLFVTASALLAFHFLWVTGLGVGILLRRDLGASGPARWRWANQLGLFWAVGILALVHWMVMFVV